MYAVFKTGGKQYTGAKDDFLRVEKLDGNEGDTVEISEVLMIAGEGMDEPTFGNPFIANAKILAKVVEQTRNAKIKVLKKRRRQNYRRTKGHKQQVTVIQITDIVTGG